MFTINKQQLELCCSYKLCIFVCCVVIALTTTANAQQNQPQQYQFAMDEARRRFNGDGGYSGFSAASLTPSSDFIKFPDDDGSRVPAPSRFYDDGKRDGEGAFDYEKKRDISSSDKSSHSQMSNEITYVPFNLTEGMQTYEDFFNLLDEDIEVIAPRFGGEDVERSQSKRPVPANCVPEMTVVPLTLSDSAESRDPTIVVFPTCTRVKRCGGCCNNNLLSCQPVESNTIVFEVFKSQYQGGNKVKFLNKEPVLVEEHTRCKCDCRKKEKDCTRFQRYYKSQCLCSCTNIEDKNKCLAEKSDKIWDPDNCLCRCREIENCSTGANWDPNVCKCLQKTGHREIEAADRKRFIVKPIYVSGTPDTLYQSET